MLRLIILAIALSELIIPMPSRVVNKGGLVGRQPIVQPGAVNWWQESAQPGQNENIVLYGHDRDVFKNLHRVRPGMTITLAWDGQDYDYTISKTFIVDEDVPPAQRAENGKYILPAGREQLTLVTCYGEDRLIVIAYPIGN
jgi:LPXTG-site transpeptidase (sortase) family protein